jgi:hypothetical protein
LGKLRLSDEQLAVLLSHMARGAPHPLVGFSHTHKTIDEVVKDLSRSRIVNLEDVECALWSCNLLDEQGEFMHPYGQTFDQFVLNITPTGKVFDKFFNVFLDKDVK